MPAGSAGPAWVESGCMPERARERSKPSLQAAACGVDGDSRRQRSIEGAVEGACSVDRRIGRLATRQDGIVERRQLIGLGVTGAAVDHG